MQDLQHYVPLVTSARSATLCFISYQCKICNTMFISYQCKICNTMFHGLSVQDLQHYFLLVISARSATLCFISYQCKICIYMLMSLFISVRFALIINELETLRRAPCKYANYGFHYVQLCSFQLAIIKSIIELFIYVCTLSAMSYDPHQ